MTSSNQNENPEKLSWWRSMYVRTAWALGLLAGVATVIAAFTGHLSSIEQFGKSLLYPALPELVLRDSRFVEIQALTPGHYPDPRDIVSIVIETVVEKKGGSGVQEWNAEFLNAENTLRNSDGRQDRQVHDYSFRAGSEQRRMELYFEMYRQDLTKEAKLRLVCKKIITPWNSVSGMPDQKPQ
jgi:hypothetical protein